MQKTEHGLRIFDSELADLDSEEKETGGYIRDIIGLYWGYVGNILGLLGIDSGYIGVILGLYLGYIANTLGIY